MSEIEDLRSQLDNRLLDEGVLIFWQHDRESVNHDGHPWAYTVGRSMAGRPELLVTGLDEETSQRLLKELEDQDVCPDLPVATCVGWVGFIMAETGLLHAAYCVFGTGYSALQIIYNGEGPQPLHPVGGFILTDPYPED